MKTKLAFIGAILIIGIAAMLDSPPPSSEDSIYYQMPNDESVDADAQIVQRSVASSLEFVLEAMEEIDGNIVETYQEYVIHKDAEGNIISRVPTENYQYLTYHKE
jgi:hypothetical protein